MEQGFIALRDVSYVFEEQTILRGVNMTICRDKLYALIGPNGGGKTVLLKLIAGIYQPTSGEVEVLIDKKKYLMREAIEKHRINVGFIFEHGGFISNLSVFDNIALPLRYYADLDEADIRKRVDGIVGRLELNEYVNNRPAQLSLGNKRRVNLAVAIANRPQLMLYDNPMMGLDIVKSKAIKNLISVIHKEYNTASLISTNNMIFARDTADYVIFVDNNTVLGMDTFRNLSKSDIPAIREYFSNFNADAV